MFFKNYFLTMLSQAEKLFDIIQHQEIELKYVKDKTSDFIQYVENYYNEYYENTVQETMAAIEPFK